jgi:hypothetical protein
MRYLNILHIHVGKEIGGEIYHKKHLLEGEKKTLSYSYISHTSRHTFINLITVSIPIVKD